MKVFCQISYLLETCNCISLCASDVFCICFVQSIEPIPPPPPPPPPRASIFDNDEKSKVCLLILSRVLMTHSCLHSGDVGQIHLTPAASNGLPLCDDVLPGVTMKSRSVEHKPRTVLELPGGVLLGGELLAERCRTDDLMPSIPISCLPPCCMDGGPDPEVQGLYTSTSIVLSQVARGRPTGLLQSVGGLRAAAMTRW